MPFPSHLPFRDRVADDATGYYFLCARIAEHPDRKRCRKSFPTRADRDTYVTRHDVMFHDSLLAGKLGLTADSPLLGDVVADFLERLEGRWRRGKADVKTLEFYRGIARRLLAYFGADVAIAEIRTPAILGYVEARRREGTTAGARIKKEVSALGTMLRDCGYIPQWVLRRGAIDAEPADRKPLNDDDTAWLIRAMTAGSIERDVIVFKLSTMVRNEELYAANVGDVHLQRRELVYRLRNKRGEVETHTTYLNDAAIEIATRRVAGRKATAPLFELEERRLQQSSLRKRLIAASARATILRRQRQPRAAVIHATSIGSLRSLGSTIVQTALKGSYDAANQLGHKSEKTTRRNYHKPQKAAVVESSRRATGAVQAMLDSIDAGVPEAADEA